MNPDQRREKKMAKRKAVKELARQRERTAEAARRLMVSQTDVSIQREVAHIIECAAQRDGRVVVIGGGVAGLSSGRSEVDVFAVLVSGRRGDGNAAGATTRNWVARPEALRRAWEMSTPFDDSTRATHSIISAGPLTNTNSSGATTLVGTESQSARRPERADCFAGCRKRAHHWPSWGAALGIGTRRRRGNRGGGGREGPH